MVAQLLPKSVINLGTFVLVAILVLVSNIDAAHHVKRGQKDGRDQAYANVAGSTDGVRRPDIRSLLAASLFEDDLKDHARGPLMDQTVNAIRNGYLDAVRQSVTQISGGLLKAIFGSLSRARLLFASYLHKMAYRSNPLQVNDLMHISRHIYTLCLPYAKFSPANMNRDRRAQAFQPDDLDSKFSSTNWPIIQKELISELQYGINYLKRALPAHNIEYLNAAPGGLQEKLANLLNAFSVHDDLSVSFYLVRTMVYINNLIELIKTFRSLEEAQQNFEETHRWLSCIVQSFDQAAHFLDPEITSRGGFPRGATQASNGGVGSLEALLGQLNTAN